MRGHRIMAITSAFQADDAGSIPAARSKLSLKLIFFSDFPNLSFKFLLHCYHAVAVIDLLYLLPQTAGIKKPLQNTGARLRYNVPHIFGVNPTEVS